MWNCPSRAGPVTFLLLLRGFPHKYLPCACGSPWTAVKDPAMDHSSLSGLSTMPLSLPFPTFCTLPLLFPRDLDNKHSLSNQRHFEQLVIKLVLCKV